MNCASSHNQKKDNNKFKKKKKKNKTKKTQNCQKNKLYGSPTTKEFKKKHSSRQVRGVEMGSHGGKDSQQGGGWQTGWSHIFMQINQE